MTDCNAIKRSLQLALALPPGGKSQAVLNSAGFFAMADEDQLMLAGERADGWKESKKKLIRHQKTLGLNWKTMVGAGGPIAFECFSAPAHLGDELASQYLNAGLPGGDFSALVLDWLHLDPSQVDKLKLHFLKPDAWSAARERFSKYVNPQTHERFVFAQGPGYKFQRARTEIKFKGNETQLQKKLEGLDSLRQQLGVNGVKQKLSHQFKQYRNVDLAAYRVVHRAETDALEVFAIEVKNNNSISAVMTAIGQATAYKVMADRCYVAAPGLNESDFHEPARFQEIRRICEDSGIGIISIQLASDKDLQDVRVVLEPRSQSPFDPGFQDACAKIFQLEFCLVCLRWIAPGTECGWQAGPENSCMKEAILKLINQGTPTMSNRRRSN